MKIPAKKVRAPKLGWSIRTSRYLVYEDFMNVRQDDVQIGQKKFSYTYLEHPGAVFSVALTSDFKIPLIRIFRYPLDAWCWEIPSGGLGDKKGQTPLYVAKAELAEEAGYESKKWIPLGWKWSANGVAKLKLFFFLALDATPRETAHEEAEQISRIQLIPISSAEAWLKKIQDGDSVLALLLALRKIQDLKIQR